MPRAKNLKEAYNNFYVEPLKEDQEFTEFYVDRPGISPMTDLKERIEIADPDHNGGEHLDGRQFYSDVILKRIDKNLLDDGVLKYAIESTGKLTELIEVMREASLNAHRGGQDQITKKDVTVALDKLRMTFDRTLNEAHKRKLLEINSCKEAREEGPDSVLVRELLFSLNAVEYEDDEGRWCAVNSMLLPLVKKWSQSP